jgi:micrococcal nuclease
MSVMPFRASEAEWQKATVERVVDGDTIIVQLGDKRETVRLLRVDTPESKHQDAQRNTPAGAVARSLPNS